MVAILTISFMVLVFITLLSCGRIVRLERELEWWRNGYMKLNNQKFKEE